MLVPTHRYLGTGAASPPRRASEHRLHPGGRYGLRRCASAESELTYPDAPPEPSCRSGDHVHRRPYALGRLHPNTLRPSHGTLRLAHAAETGCSQRLWRASDRAGTTDGGVVPAATWLPHGDGRQVAPGTGFRQDRGRLLRLLEAHFRWAAHARVQVFLHHSGITGLSTIHLHP